MDVNKFHFRGYNRHVIILPRSSSAPAGYTLAATENTNNGQELVNEISPDIAKNVNALDHAFGLLAMVGISVNKTARQIASKLLEAINQNRLSVYTENDKTSLYYSNETNSLSGSAPSTSSAKTPNVNQSNQGKKSLNSSEAGSSSNNTATEVPIADQECRSDPISMLSGEEILPLIDFELNGLMPIVWRRLYRSSKIKQNLGLGYGWRHNYSMQLVQKYQEPPKVGPKQPGKYWLELTDEEGRLHVFDKVKRGQTSYQLSSGLALVHQADGSHTLIKSDDSHWTFTEQVTKSINETSSTRQSSRKKKEQPQPTWLLQSISNNQGQYIQLNYDDKQRLVELSPGPKRGIKLQYNVDNNIIRIAAYYIDEHNKTHVHNNLLANYQYDDSQALIAATNSSGNVERYTYHKQRIELGSEDVKTAIKPQLSYLLKKRTRSSGFSHHFEWQGTGENAQCIKQWGDNDTYQYQFKFFTDERGKVSTSTDSNGNTETFIHNEQGLLTAFTNANGHTSYNKYDSAGRKIKAIDYQGNVTEFSYNQQGQLSLVITPDGAITRYLYNGLGKRISTIDPLGQETKRIFDGTGRLISEIMPDGRSQSYEYTLAGLLHKKTDLSGVITQYHWDNTGELLAKKIGNTLTRFSYNTLGLLIATVDSQGLITQFNRNEQGQITEQISYSQSTPDDKITQRYVYDESGRLTSHEFVEATQTNEQAKSTEQTSYQYDGLAQPSKKTFSDGSWLAYEYDSERNLTAIKRSDGATYQIAYSPTEKPVELIGFDGRKQRFTYDTNDQLVSVNDSDLRFIRLKRDSLGHIIEQSASRTNNNLGVQGKSNASQHNYFQHDAIGRLVRAHNSERTVSLRYHKNGQLSTSVQGHWALNYDYNNLGQRSTLHLPDGSEIHYQYTEQGQLSGISYVNKTHNASKPQSLVRYAYNNAGLNTQQTLGNSIELTQHYDVYSRLTEQHWQANEHHTHLDAAFSEYRRYQYDHKHQLTLCEQSPDKTAEASQNSGLIQPVQKTFTYNSISQLLQSNVIKQVDEKTQTSQATQYQWDAFGNPQSKIDSTLKSAKTDSSNADSSNADSSNSDSHHNDIVVKHDQLHRFAGNDYRFDDCGNQISCLGKDNKQQRVYNGFNQLTQLNHNGKLTHYEYDALGRRSAKITEQGRIDFIWDNNQLIGEHQNGKFTWFVYQPDTFLPVALIKSASGANNSEVYYYHLDQLGTPICLTDSNAKQVWRNDSDVFGCQQTEEIDGNEKQGFINTIDNPLRFQGQYFDEESHLHYNRFRYYCPKQQRFINQDPIGLVGGINHYQYAPNPVNYVDPLGLLCKEGQAKVAKAISDNGNIPAELEAKLIAITQLEDSGYTADEMIEHIDRGTVNQLINDPLSDPKVAKVIKKDSFAIYGYSPKQGKGLDKFGIDFSDPEQVAKARAKRIDYLAKLNKKKLALTREVKILQDEGMSLEDIAMLKVNERNQSRIDSYVQTDNVEGLKSMQERNLLEYGRKQGPTADQLFEKKGSWENVIFGSVNSSRAMDILLGLD
ncbi:RHS repeat-associated core domain-containing protein [Colwellia sp. UCD-KL20]|uniref:RHS repeat-associated core domain-containing protein n=1 Tax=Colwellia sp. UCD-KL20 TaxID=1917165 RepID=UPI00097075FD|nr:RHS repeat-associated core domain-containing protein [Colwellia sp. UCD-KL20]